MTRKLTPDVALGEGIAIPRLTLGLYNLTNPAEVARVMASAIEAGYRSFDDAALYGNEAAVGATLRSLAIPRDQLFLTSKVWNSQQGYAETLAAFEASLARLGLDYLDLYLLHWPVPGKYQESWRALEKLYADGRVRAIGVSNFGRHHLEDLLSFCTVRPAVNQVELHPLLSQEGLRRYCAREDIQLAAWSPLMHGKILSHPTVVALAEKYGRSAAQITLRWILERGVIAVAKAASAAHLQENLAVFDFELSETDVRRLDGLNRDQRIGPDPDLVDYSSDREFLWTFAGWEPAAAA